MRELFILVAHPLATLAKLMRPGGVRSVVAESLLLKHQLLTLKRSRKRAQKLTSPAYDHQVDSSPEALQTHDLQ